MVHMHLHIPAVSDRIRASEVREDGVSIVSCRSSPASCPSFLSSARDVGYRRDIQYMHVRYACMSVLVVCSRLRQDRPASQVGPRDK